MSIELISEEIYLACGGLMVRLELVRTPDGPLLKLSGKNCDLEGVEPGAYLLVAFAETPS